MEPGPAHRRRRPAVACSECRRRKIRCDRGFPCGPCRKSLPMLSCIYHSQPRPLPHRNTASSSSSASALPNAHASQHQPRPQSSSSSSSTARDIDLAKVDLLAFDPDAFAGIGQIGLDWNQPGWSQQQHRDLTPPTALLAEAVAAAAAVDCFPGFPVPEDCIQKRADLQQSTSRRYLGSPEATRPSPACHPMGFCPAYGDDGWLATLGGIPKLSFLVEGMSNTEDAKSGRCHRKCKGEGDDSLRLPPLTSVVTKLQHQARSEKEQSDRESLARLSPLLKGSSKTRQLLPPRQACKKLVNAYFETFGSVLCVLDTAAFFDDFERFWDSKDGLPSPRNTERSESRKEAFAHKLLVIVALGSVTSPGSTGAGTAEAERTRQISRRNHAIVCVQYTRQWLAEKTARGIRADLDVAQILCLLALARLTQLHTDPSPRRPSIDGAVLLTGDHDLARLGMQMGLHREPRPSSVVNKQEAELRRRLWATMLELSLHQYLDAGLPPPLSAESYDCAEPSPDVLEENVSDPLDNRRASASAVLAALSRTQRLRLRILQHLYAPGVSTDSSEGHRLAIELSGTCSAEVNRLMRSETTQPTGFQLWLLNILIRPFVLAFNAPYDDDGTRDIFASYFFSRLRMENAVSILRPGPQEDGLSSLRPVTPQHQGGSRNKSTAATYPFLPTPSTVELPCGVSPQHGAVHRAACDALCNGPSRFAAVHRQALATLCTDLVAEIQDNLFPALDSGTRHALLAVLEDAVGVYREQVRASGGVEGCREFVLFAAAHGLVSGGGSGAPDVDAALRLCCAALGEPLEEMEWLEKSRSGMGDMLDGDDEVDAQMQKVDFVLEHGDDVQGLDLAAVDTEIADMWALDEEESYFSIDVTL